MKIIWSKKAIIDYHNIIDFLLLEWSENSAEKFKDLVYFKTQLIRTHPDAFEKTDFENIHKVIITKQVTLYFRITHSEIELLRFWNNAQNLEYLSL